MSDISIHSTVNPRNPYFPTEEFGDSISKVSGRSVTIDPKWKPLFVVFIVLGMIGLGVAAYGVANIGAQQHWWSPSLIQLNQTYSMAFAIVGGILGSGFFVWGIVGLVKIQREKQVVDHSAENSAQTQPSVNVTTPPTTNRKGQICIATPGGYIGDETRRQLLPEYLKNIALEDGSSLPLAAEDFFIEIFLFNVSRQLKKTGIPSPLYLPGVLFKDKRDGDSIRLKYKDQLIELTIDQQNHGLKFAKGSFQEILALHVAYIKETCDAMTSPLCATFDPFWFYNLGDKGVIYKLETYRPGNGLSICHLKDGASADFRPKIAPVRIPGDILLSEDKTKLIVVMDFCSFQPEDFDIVLNESHFFTYGRFENRALPRPPVDLIQGDTQPEEDNLNEGQKTLSSEAMYGCQWDKIPCFKDRSLEEMKIIMKKSSLCLTAGVLQLMIPLL